MENQNENWETIILQKGEGEKILFRIGLMTFKISSSQSNNSVMICETELPPEAYVEPHSHPEAETFYILDGEFTFYVENMNKPIECATGAFISVPPHIEHSFKNTGKKKGKIFGTLMPGGAKGLESLFRTLGVELTENDGIPDLDKPVNHLTEAIKKLRKNRKN